jgi:kynurenine formamidase
MRGSPDLDIEEGQVSTEPEAGTQYEAILERDGVRVSKSPWGPDDEIGRMNWITAESRRAVLEHLDGRAVFDLGIEYFFGMPSWSAAHDPKYEIWMTHTPQGSINDNLSGAGPEVHEKYSYCGDSIHMYIHTGTHLDTLNHLGYFGMFWNGWTAEKDLGSRVWLKGGVEKYPPVIARAVLLDIAGLHGVDCLPPGHVITPGDLRAAAREQGTELQPHDVVLLRTGRMTCWPDFDTYIPDNPGLGVAGARYLCEDIGAMCIGTDAVSMDVAPHEEPDTFVPVHCYMFATAGAQIIEVLDLEEIAAERVYEFALLAFPLKLRGATGSPIRPVAVPLRA